MHLSVLSPQTMTCPSANRQASASWSHRRCEPIWRRIEKVHLRLAVYRGRAVGVVSNRQVLSAPADGADKPKNLGSLHRRMLQEWMRDPEFRAEYERVRAEIFEQLAPASEGPVVNPGRKRRGRLVFGDDTD
jgi:hypothetical protein